MVPRVILDLETTGFSTTRNSIWEIGAIKVNGKDEPEEFHRLLNPQTKFHKGALEVTGVDPRSLDDKPLFREIRKELLEFIKDYPIIAYNASFDIRFLKASDPTYARNPVYDYLKTMRKKRKLSSYKLEEVAKTFNIPHEAHTALGDAKALYELIKLVGWPSDRERI